MPIAMGFAESALATTGGPERAEVIGYDPSEGKLFYLVSNDNSPNPAIYYFHLTGARPGTPARVDWTRHVKEITPAAHDDFVRRLRGRLLPLDSMPASAFDARFRTVRSDRGGFGGYEYPRLLLRGTLGTGSYRASATVLAYNDEDVRVIAGYTVPGEQFMVAIVSFIGIPYESAYRVQMPVVLSRRPLPLRRLEWSRW